MPAQISLFVLPANTVQGASMLAQIIPFVLPANTANTVQGASMTAQIIPFELNKCSTTKTLKRVSLGKMVTGPGILENPGPNIASISQV